jgi:hypothetical protein
MKKNSFRSVVFFAALVILLGRVEAWAQTTATISGTVTDQSGGVIPRAQIIVTNLDTGQSRALVTDDMGRYYAPALNPGRYKVAAAAKGFERAVQSDITLTVGFEQVINFTLRPGQVSESIEVRGEPPAVQTTSASVAELVNTQTVRALPLNGRSFDQLIFLQPGVNVATSAGNSPNQGRGNKFSVGGARLTSNVFMLDGMDMNDSQNFTPGGAGGQLLGVESILEFQVITHNASAQYGRSMGGIINAASKSGTNALHGDVYEFLRNSVFDAKNFFDNPNLPIPPLRRNQFGASAGGPIRRNHLFFFANYEGLRELQGVTKNGTVPIASTRQLCNPPIDPTKVNPSVCDYLLLYPPASPPDGTTLLFSQNQPTRGDYGTAKIDWNPNEKSSFFVRYTMDNSSKLRQDAPDHVLGLFAEDETHRNQYLSLVATRVFSPKVLNTARFGFNRSTLLVDLFNQANVPQSLSFIRDQPFGRIRVGGLSTLGATINDPRSFRMNSFQPGDDLSITRGAHALKTGFILERFQWNTAAFNRIGGDYAFASLADCGTPKTPKPCFLQARVKSVDAPFPGSEPSRGLRAILFGAYFQDDYRVSRRLTVNLGLRYELTTVPTEVNGKMSFLLDPSATALVNQQPFKGNHLNFAPRIGFAWDLKGDGKTAVRGGWGIYYDQILLNQFLNMFDRNPPQWLTITLPQAPPAPALCRTALFFPHPLTFDVVANCSAFTLQNAVFNDFKTPYSYHYNLTVQREIVHQVVVSIAYVGSRGKHLIERFDGNTPTPLPLPNPTAVCPSNYPAGTICAAGNGARRNPGTSALRLGVLQTRRLSGLSYYNALQVLVSRRFTSGLQVQGSYTYSKSIDTSAGLFSEEANNAPTAVEIPDRIFNDKGQSNFDVRHSAVINLLYELPFGKNLQGFARQVLKGWELGGIMTFSSGVPFSVVNSENVSRNLATQANFADRPNLVPGASNNPTHGVSIGNCSFPNPSGPPTTIKAGTPVGTPTLFFDPCAFAPQPLGTFGNLGRNTLIGPGLSDVDFLVSKHFRMGEQRELQFRAEFFNVLNHPNFEAPSVNLTAILSASAGGLTKTTTTSRQIQFGLKFIF